MGLSRLGSNIFDVVVIGGGIIGTATAYHLARAGVRVCVAEKQMFASGATGACMGNLSFHNRMPGPLWDLAVASRQLYQTFATTSSINFEFTSTPSLMLIEDPNALDWAKTRAGIQRQAGLDVDFLTREELEDLDETVGTNIVGAIYCRSSARLNPFLLCSAFAVEAQKAGATLLTHQEISGIVVHQGKVSGVRIGQRKIAAGIVINAGGVDAERIAKLANIDLPLIREAGVILVTEKLPQMTVKLKGECTEGNINTGAINQLETFYKIRFVFSQTLSGNCLIGRSGQVVDHLARPAPEVVTAILRRAIRFMPCLAHVAILRTFVGVRPCSPDSLPILGAVDEPAGFFIAAGFGDKGIALGAAAAALLARAVLEDTNIVPAIYRPQRLLSQLAKKKK